MARTVRLDDQLCFALYAATNAITRTYRPLLRDIGLTYPQYLVLMVLWEDDGLNIGQIAERLQLPGNAVTPLVTRLELLGLVGRTRDVVDTRVVRVRLTAAGTDLESAAAAAQHQVACRTDLDEVSFAALRAQLHDLAETMHAAAACDLPEGEAS